MQKVPNAIQLQEVSKHFGHTIAVDDVSLELERGEFFSLLGPSGCGKSTILRMIAGFEEPTRGGVAIGGEWVGSTPANKRPTNMVFQNYAIFPHLNVEDNIAFGLRRSGLSRKEIAQKVRESLERIDLLGFEKRRATELSGGERQRVALARALILQPEVLLLDEPLSALDKKLREQMQIELRRLQRSVGITFILVTHDQNEAMTISDRCGVMFDGRLAQVDTPTRLYDRPTTRRVAAFIGGMNFLEGAVESVADNAIGVSVASIGCVRVNVSNASVSVGEWITLGIRPERVYLANEWFESAEAVARATVKDVIFYGESIHYFLNIDDCEDGLVASVTNIHHTQRFREGDQIFMGVNGRSMVLLP